VTVLDLKDLFHLPQLDGFIDRIASDGPGLVVVAGFDSPLSTAQGGVPASGRAGLFRILARHLIDARPGQRVMTVTATPDPARRPRGMHRNHMTVVVKPPDTYADCIARAAALRPDLIVVDHMDVTTAPAIFDATRAGLRVVTQVDTIFRGAELLRYLLDTGMPPEALTAAPVWVIGVQRVPALCPTCRQAHALDEARRAALYARYPGMDRGATYYRPQACPECGNSGRRGDVAVFDVFNAPSGHAMRDVLDQPSQLTVEDYMLALAAQGYLAIDDVVRLETDRLRSLQQLLVAGERAWSESNIALQSKLVELETSNRVLQQRTEALISLEKLGAALITSTDLAELASSVCRLARNLCGAGRAILYFLRSEEVAEVLAVSGWSADLVRAQLDAGLVFGPDRAALRDSAQPAVFAQWPPGVPYREPDLEGARLYQGLRLPLVSQDKLVGLLIVHPTTKPRFAQGEVALLRTLANQAALAIQRAELVETLRAKIVQLETAQAALVRKERLERELELARQVQESLLPRSFPTIPGYAFAARSVPARQVGGDFYDVIRLDAEGHRFGLVIADVSDKGMPAALFMALTRSLLMAEAERETSPRAVLASVNRLLLQLADSDMFVAMFYGVVDTRTRLLTYTRAGHDLPLLLRNGAVQALGGEGMVLGRLEAEMLRLSEEQIALESGDRLALFTDGLSDALNGQGEMFGLPALKELLQGNAHLPAIDLCAATFARLSEFQGSADQFDDMALLVMEIVAPNLSSR
jgi:serine phosphatase RsbU (regulator of sigma subunit)